MSDIINNVNPETHQFLKDQSRKRRLSLPEVNQLYLEDSPMFKEDFKKFIEKENEEKRGEVNRREIPNVGESPNLSEQQS